MDGAFDKQLLEEARLEYLAGIDEAGRGPCAGPVVACACMAPESLWPALKDVNDSKKLSDVKRRELFLLIKKLNIKYALAFVHAEEIDRINILQATFKAMNAAAQRLSAPPNTLFAIDGNKTVKQLNHPQKAVIKGDSKSISIACASIIAKVARDNWMLWLDQKFPLYNFAKHKGYWTAMHEETVKKHGICNQHRRSFIPMWYQVEKI